MDEIPNLSLRDGEKSMNGHLEGKDIMGFEALNRRAVAVVVDPIQSVKGKVVIDAFRLINPNTVMLGQEPRQTTSNLGQLNKPSCQALIHGLKRNYYSLAVNFRMNGLEEKMLLNLHKKKWTDGLTMRQFDAHSKTNEQTLQKHVSSLASRMLHFLSGSLGGYRWLWLSVEVNRGQSSKQFNSRPA
ncbi:unnamed protein product [Prunus armeniaca]|uniref:Rpn11/EIF3F C-terminal domain-containing protein n=1 Tax=Prunus armeniaca TaxID=36596 RepID=A0A6J5URS9_PRUAR|nr:unnamed protein product [Prunus armeniaca]